MMKVIYGWVCKGTSESDIFETITTDDETVDDARSEIHYKELVMGDRIFKDRGFENHWNPGFWPPKRIKITIEIDE